MRRTNAHSTHDVNTIKRQSHNPVLADLRASRADKQGIKKGKQNMTNKFQTHELFKDGKRYTPIPQLFFRLWYECRDLPASFWCTLLHVLNTTLGGSMAGLEGHLAQSQIPVDPHESSRWIAAMAGYGRLIKVDYSDGRDQKGSKFTFNPDATEDDWVSFVFALRAAHQEGALSREKHPDEVRELFRRYSEAASVPTFWSEVLRCVINEQTVAPGTYEDWVKRGFDLQRFRRYCDETFENDEGGGDAAIDIIFMNVCHAAWVLNRDVTITDDELNEFRKHHEELQDMPISSEAWSKLLARFKRVQDVDLGSCRRNDWLAQEWAQAKDRHSLLSRPHKQTFDS